MMKLLFSREHPREELLRIIQPRVAADSSEPERVVREICRDVRERGDQAVLEYVRRFDTPALNHPAELAVSAAEFEEAVRTVSQRFRSAVEVAIANIERYHRKQLRASWMDVNDDTLLGQIIRPIRRVGIYVPGGKAPLASTLLMCAVPARTAGVPFLQVCTPANQHGRVDPHILYAARACGIDRVFKVGGAQGIAAMAYGTATIPRVDKVVGPGNIYVVLAKREVLGEVGIESLPGPS
ncbi:MAG: histidinol dehydrogenase, partial [Armatimonadota bacterium]|nr:histidinol dehydrogenase [Armatimonadota bacterium]